MLGLSVAGLAGAACLPELFATPDAGRPVGCGDGIITPDAGETCDPGPFSDPSCTNDCRVACAPGPDGGGGFYVDPSSNHCYMAYSAQASETEATQICNSLGAHVVTLVNPAETTAVVDKVNGGASRYWVGLKRQGQGMTYSSVRIGNDEPGWAPASTCTGCYAPNVARQQGLIVVDGGADAGPPECVIGRSSGAAETIGCNASAKVICEREPVGSRSYDCTNGYCFNLVATAGQKHYYLSSVARPAAAAASYCTSHFRSDGGPNGTLVILYSDEEREQLVWELLQLGASRGITPPATFWIGLTATTSDAGAADGGKPPLVWEWDDFTPDGLTSVSSPRPSVWGGVSLNPDPTATAGLRAYLELSSRYDTGLVHSDQMNRGGALPFVCEWLQ